MATKAILPSSCPTFQRRSCIAVGGMLIQLDTIQRQFEHLQQLILPAIHILNANSMCRSSELTSLAGQLDLRTILARGPAGN
ncbi:hypothetical protein HAX54_041136 [Datura stramonium]|uniref:Uncharacterized protein n=1 Tax=Datura stramonium TaxID=4076 RepID=A0ABS8VPY7_DATST|nr:hypothetical protein [Datura stramonium]